MARAVASGIRADFGAARTFRLPAHWLRSRSRPSCVIQSHRHSGATSSRRWSPCRATPSWRGARSCVTTSRRMRGTASPCGHSKCQALEAENDRLRRALGLGHSLGWGFVPAEALHSRALGEEYTLTLTRGSRAGIRPFSPVVAPEGLVGMVETVDPTMSLAITWSHPDFRVSAMAADGSAFGIVKAHLGIGTRALSARAERRANERHALAGDADRELGCGRRVSARHPGRDRDRRGQDLRRAGRGRISCSRQ